MSYAGQSPLRVVRLYFRYPPEPGGMEQHIQRLSEAQRRLGVEVINVFNRGQSAASTAIQLLPGLNLGVLRPQALRNAVFYAGAALSRRLNRAATSGNGPLVVHAHGAWSDFLLAQGLARLLGASATVGSIHGKLHDHRFLRTALSGLGAVFVTGRRDFEAVRGLIGDRAIHMPSAPDDTFFDLPLSVCEAEYDLVCVGSLVPVKRVDLILECAKRMPTRTFAIVGAGPDREALSQLATRLRLGNVTFLGALSQAQVKAVLDRARAFVSTSVEEGTPTAMLEALASGLPVIVTPSNDYSWILDRTNGAVAGDWSVDTLVSLMERTLDDPNMHRPSQRQVNREKMRTLSWDQNAAKVTQTMLSCTGQSTSEEVSR